MYSKKKSIVNHFYGYQPHPALENSETEIQYLRKIVDFLLKTILPSNEIQSSMLQLLVGEILTTVVLQDAINKICKPEFIFEVAILVTPLFSLFFSL